MNRIISKVAISVGTLLVCATTAFADSVARVNVMPDRQVRPGVALPVFGSEDGGTNALGHTGSSMYTWTFAFNPLAVSVASTTPGPALVVNDRYIVTNTTFTLIPPATRQTVTATLTIVASDASTASNSVKIDVVSTSDPISLAPLDNQQINVNIAIEHGLRALYLSQDTGTGGWAFSGGATGGANVTNCATTGYTVWAFSNGGHRPTNPVAGDIYAEWVGKAVNNYILNTNSSVITSGFNPSGVGTTGGSFNPDGDLNGRIIALCPGGTEGYATGIAAAGIEAAYSANALAVHAGGPVGIAGQTIKQIIQDAMDWIAFAQQDGISVAEGGWRYSANGGSDTSADSWNYVSMEGFKDVFSGSILEAVLREAELRIDSSQAANGQFGYTGNVPINGVASGGNATTAGGLSGLNLVTFGGRVPFYLNSPPHNVTFPNVAARKVGDVGALGTYWPVAGNTWTGNMPNFYAMWTGARAMRLNGTTTLSNSTTIHGATTFDWQTGEPSYAPLTVPPAADPLEGYFAFLTRTQVAGVAGGQWAATVNTGNWPQALNTAWGVLILQPRVFPAAGDCSLAAPSVSSLAYPLDHTLRDVTISNVQGNVRIDAICQDENPNFEGIPAYSQDGDGLLTNTAKVRAEFSGTRAAPSNGRVYTIFYTATDLFCSGKVKVAMNKTPSGVPPAVDDSGATVWNSVTGAASCPQVP